MTPDKARTCFHYEKEIHLFDTINKWYIIKYSEFLKAHVNKSRLHHRSCDVDAENINQASSRRNWLRARHPFKNNAYRSLVRLKQRCSFIGPFKTTLFVYWLFVPSHCIHRQYDASIHVIEHF